jgi:hypothetical protein
MSDRPVSLDLRTLAGDAGSLPGQQQQSHRKPSDADPSLTERFAAALALNPVDERQSDDSVLETPFALLRQLAPIAAKLAPIAESSFDDGSRLDTVALATPPDSAGDAPAPAEHLFNGDRSDPTVLAIPGLLAVQPGPVETTQPEAPNFPGRQQLLEGIADIAKRLLVSDGSGGRREVRIELSDSALSGVTVSVYQAAGEWVAEFNCREPGAFNVLSEAAVPMAQELADTLRSPACWLVMIEPPDDNMVEARALPERTTI